MIHDLFYRMLHLKGAAFPTAELASFLKTVYLIPSVS